MSSGNDLTDLALAGLEGLSGTHDRKEGQKAVDHGAHMSRRKHVEYACE